MEDNNKREFSPRLFMKARRPERFSDSIVEEVGSLGRDFLEFTLSNLKRKNKELAFEDFAKKLCEKVICPNLLEQTGPVAGGDGKTDTQTFPVSEQSKVLWYVGVNEASESERWAFAVSTQENWKSKCRQDVKKIEGTARGYKKIFCITSCYTKSNQRSDLEDSLSKETGIDIRILDASWIVDEVFKNKLEKLAIETLSIDIDWQRKVKQGANDYEKTSKLNELNKLISSEIDVTNITPNQLDWLLEVAVLSKELEKPRLEVQGLFERATKAAEKFGFSQKQFDARYQFAWAAYWWFEDYELFYDNLLICVELAKKICISVQWRDAVTLLGIYISQQRHSSVKGVLHNDSIIQDAKKCIEALAEVKERPSNSLMSKINLEMLSLYCINDIDSASEHFTNILGIVKEGENLIGFPFYEIYDLINELDEVFGDSENYESLLDFLTEQASCRDGEVRAAQLWLKRGAKRLESNRPYQAIKLIGKSLVSLYKQETRREMYSALSVLAAAYQKVGLLWAARANLLFAASIATDEFWKSGELSFSQTYSYARLARVELLLGRIHHSLSFWEIARITENGLGEDIISEEESNWYEAFLSQCLVNADLNELCALTKLPDVLERLGLYFSRSILLYVLGHENILEEEYRVSVDDDYVRTALVVRDTNIGANIPKLSLASERYTSLQSKVMGCSIDVFFPARSPLVELAESILASIEAFFSTGLVDQLLVIESELRIELTADDDDLSITHDFDASSEVLKAEVTCSIPNSGRLGVSEQGVIQGWLGKFVIDVLVHMFRYNKFDEELEKLFGEDRALERSVPFSSCFVVMNNIFGDRAYDSIKGILTRAEVEEYKLLRSKGWDENHHKVKPADQTPKIGKESAPEGLFDYDSLQHYEYSVKGLIKARLWDKAKWKGIAFSQYPNGMLGLDLVYENFDFAKTIWTDIAKKVGQFDENNRLRISIITGIDRKNPFHYKVVISENIDASKGKVYQIISRIHQMEPKDNSNMSRFLEAFRMAGKVWVSCVGIKDGKLVAENGKDKFSVLKSEINIVEAWSISENDPDLTALSLDDEPIVPEGILSPPYLQTIAKRKAMLH
ncbi:hypothetical protein [Paenalcaligenes faecalis]|uniref:hypothetical protein n=1 Tax=Paenalcaligenes faecalis TaxID=2980099 RepID=UPI0022B95DBA|nr:hypothetical protein [Paenalcaligenes faecalis]